MIPFKPFILSGLGVNIDCVQKDRVRRQIGTDRFKRQIEDNEQAYDLQISFPTLDTGKDF